MLDGCQFFPSSFIIFQKCHFMFGLKEQKEKKSSERNTKTFTNQLSQWVKRIICNLAQHAMSLAYKKTF